MSEKCTCPCIDCIEGNHCGGEFWWPPEPTEDEDPQLIGKCEYITNNQWHEMGILVEGCQCSRCCPGLYEAADEWDADWDDEP